jgi:hypothetical protein
MGPSSDGRLDMASFIGAGLRHGRSGAWQVSRTGSNAGTQS